MFVRIVLSVSLCCLGMIGLGCGGVESTPTGDITTATAGDRSGLKSMLETAAETGHLGSGLPMVQNSIKELEATDAELAKSLTADLAEFQQAEGAGQTDSAKEIAQRMVDRL